jgi:hypothetical protein
MTLVLPIPLAAPATTIRDIEMGLAIHIEPFIGVSLFNLTTTAAGYGMLPQ